VVAGLAILHFFWMRAGKHNFAEVAVYAAIVAVLLGWRVAEFARKTRLGAVPANAARAAPTASGRPPIRARG
jgi:methionine sulfoxide reductase heme-binding subunit